MTRDTLLVTGSREWTDIDTVRAWLSPLAPRPQTRGGVYRLIHGGARGADSIAGDVARELGFVVDVFPADWENDGRGAGAKRNDRMVEENRNRIRRALAFTWWDEAKWKTGISSGTGDCVSRLLIAGLPVNIVPPGSRP